MPGSFDRRLGIPRITGWDRVIFGTHHLWASRRGVLERNGKNYWLHSRGGNLVCHHRHPYRSCLRPDGRRLEGGATTLRRYASRALLRVHVAVRLFLWSRFRIGDDGHNGVRITPAYPIDQFGDQTSARGRGGSARAYGASERRVLTDVQLPLARAALMTGINQTLLLAISMLGIAAIMGAGGLGRLLYRSIANQDIALAGSGGLAFFIVAVVLDRLTQPDDSDKAGLFSRITAAWKNTRTPEALLPANTGVVSDSPKSDQAAEDARYEPVSNKERLAMLCACAGALIAAIGLFLPWNSGTGHVSAYGRFADNDLAGQSFNGLAASGGSWFGIIILLCVLAVVAALYSTAWFAGQRNRWLGPDGATIFSVAAVVTALSATLANAPDSASGFQRSSGVYISLVGCLIMAAASVIWVWNAPMGARRPLSSGVNWGRMFGASFALLLIVMAGYSGWTFDTRADSVIGPELQIELDAITEQSRIAEEAGDLAKVGSLAAEFTALISYAQRTGDVIYDGYTDEGAGLGWLALVLGLLTLVLAVPASGFFSQEELFLYRWCSVVSA